MLTLEEKGIPYESKLLQFSKNEQKSEEVLKWNQRGQLPTLVVNDSYSLNESFAACEYFERLYGKQGTKLTPDDPAQLAKMLQRKCELTILAQKGEDIIHYKIFKEGTVDGKIDEEKAKKLLDVFFEELARWERYASEGEYFAGSSLTHADLLIFPNIALFVRMGLDLEKLAPNLFKYYNRMVKRPSVEKTWPPHWKTSPGITGAFHY
jgi:glutathione S-transferase